MVENLDEQNRSPHGDDRIEEALRLLRMYLAAADDWEFCVSAGEPAEHTNRHLGKTFFEPDGSFTLRLTAYASGNPPAALAKATSASDG